MMYQRMAQLARRRQMLTATLITGAGRSMNPFTGAGRQAEEAATEWVASFKSTMQGSMGEIRDLADDIEWSLTHPRKGEKLITRLKSQLRETRGMTRRANKITNDEQRRQTLADIDKLKSQIRTKLIELGAMDATVKINTTVNGGTAALSTIVYGGGRKGQEDPRAAGGSVRAGQTYLVGERGPEMLVMGSQNGQIIPNHSLGGGGNIVVNVDGERLFQIMNRRMGRAMAMGV
jgi:hypothetical protein